MKITIRLVPFAALIGGGIWLWTVLFPSPEKIVLKKIAGLAAAANFDGGAGNITRAGKASSVVKQFADDAQIIIDLAGAGARTLSGREEIREAALGGFASLKTLNVQFIDPIAKVGADKQSAEVNCTAEVRVDDSKDFGVQELRFQLKKMDGEWFITRVETVKTLR